MPDENITSPVSYKYSASTAGGPANCAAKSSAPASVDAIDLTVTAGGVTPAGVEDVAESVMLITGGVVAGGVTTAPVIAELAQLSYASFR